MKVLQCPKLLIDVDVDHFQSSNQRANMWKLSVTFKQTINCVMSRRKKRQFSNVQHIFSMRRLALNSILGSDSKSTHVFTMVVSTFTIECQNSINPRDKYAKMLSRKKNEHTVGQGMRCWCIWRAREKKIRKRKNHSSEFSYRRKEKRARIEK